MAQSSITNTIPYNYKNLPIPGGGFVTGFAFHPVYENILYARTDIGGVYRYNFATNSWTSLINHVTPLDLSESYSLAIALDKNNKDIIYIACGDGSKGVLCVSDDQGESFSYHEIPCAIHGNAPGRGTGDRLLVDPNNSNIIYFASQTKGLLRSMNKGKTWDYIWVCSKEYNEKNEMNLTSLWIDPRVTIKINGEHSDTVHTPTLIDSVNNIADSETAVISSTIVVSTSGEQNRLDDTTRGQSLFISKDGGKTFCHLNQPEHRARNKDFISGLVASRMAFDGTYLYVTMSASGPANFSFFSNYSCDSGSSFDGRLVRYKINTSGDVTQIEDITPNPTLLSCNYGLSGISIHRDTPGLVICSTICKKDGDVVFISKDYGATWKTLLYDINEGQIEFTVPYMKPIYNGNASIIHWMSDLKINPFNVNHAVFNTGTGVFMTENLLDDSCIWRPSCNGIEETVHLNIYSPPSGDVKLIDILGDLGGFAFTDLDTPPENTFADEYGNRYITCMNADYSDNNPDYVVITPRGNWTGKTTGGLLITKDQCKNFHLLPHPYGISSYIDVLLDQIKKPNVNSGWTAISSDCKTIVWSIANGHVLPINGVVYTRDEGRTWARVQIFDKSRNLITNSNSLLKIMADRVNSNIFYGFGEDSRIYLSKDNGETFYEYDVPASFPKQTLGMIDGRNRVEIRVESGKEGAIFIAMGKNGLWNIRYDHSTDAFSFKRITKEHEYAFCQGMGKGLTSNTTCLYINGVIEGEYGFYRSFNEGITWERINTRNQMYGDIMSITGDPRVYGRVYLATGSRGVLYGEEKINQS